ncbi:glycoside hydrolase family 2 TIM barrel-domain containing protein [Flavobacterium sp. RHBU_3]|uniref:glycoside hydrolase family 2 TIM barrel-domain containing protein n=1 Tax=Flavobacterium sp. RHBU_3 TaxID=3391184 RepID=UPI003984F90A
MSKVNNKNIYRTALIATFVVGNIIVLFALSKIMDYFNTGADRSTMLHLEKETVSTYLPIVQWGSLENPGRPMEQQTLAQIEKHYLFSIYVKNNALKNNVREGIEDFYTDSARVNLFRLVDYNKKNNVSVESTTLEHHPKLEFYSADGQLVVFTDKNVVEYQKVFKGKEIISEEKDTATFKVMMLLEDGFWRIRHMKRMEKETPTERDNLNSKPIYIVNGKDIYKNGKKFKIKGINYYPKNSPWDMYGDKFNTDTISADFDIVASAGLNTIRIFVPYESFGKAELDTVKQNRLVKVMDLAAKKHLSVIVTLFDFYGDYSLESWTLTHRHAEKVINTLKNHPALMAWDIKNEPNLDFKSRGQDNVIAWLENIIPYVKEWDPNHLVTIGWSNPEDAVFLAPMVDFVSYHYYQNIDHFAAKQDKLNAEVKNPVVLEEFGQSSYDGLWNILGKDKEDQAEYHKKMQALFKEKELAFVSWTLYDFPEVPAAVVGKKPWVRNKQKEFGFIDIKGKKKPSFAHISG